MKKHYSKFTAVAIAFSIGLGSMVTVTNAKSITETLKATYNNIKVAYNGGLVTPTEEPFMINGRVYVSLRDAGQITGNSVDWKNNTVYITSQTNSSQLEQEIAQKNYTINAQASKIATLEKQLEELKGNSSNESNISSSKVLSDALKVINNEYDDEYKVDWTFVLTEKSNYVDLQIKFDGDEDKTAFNDMSSTKLKGFIEDICDTLAEEFEDTKLEGLEIKGDLYDVDSKDTLGTFKYSTSGTLTYTASTSNKSYAAMEEEILEGLLEDDYDMTLPYIRTNGNSSQIYEIPIKDLSITESRGTIKFEVEVDFRKSGSTETYADEWNDINESYCKSNFEDFMKDIADEISDEYNINSRDIDGYILDYHTDDILAEYSSNSFKFKDAD